MLGFTASLNPVLCSVVPKHPTSRRFSRAPRSGRTCPSSACRTSRQRRSSARLGGPAVRSGPDGRQTALLEQTRAGQGEHGVPRENPAEAAAAGRRTAARRHARLPAASPKGVYLTMSKLFAKLKEEFEAVLPPTIFFFVVLHLVVLIRVLMLRGTGIAVTTPLQVTLAALILGKAVLIADMLLFINRYPDKPLIYNIAWKTVIYVLVSMFIHYLERLVDFWRETGGSGRGQPEVGPVAL